MQPRCALQYTLECAEIGVRLWQTASAGMLAAHERHDAILRAAVSAHGGVLYEVIGDAMQAVLPTVPAQCCRSQAIREALAYAGDGGSLSDSESESEMKR